MKPSRLAHLRTLNRFDFYRPYSDDDRVHIRMRPKGFKTMLLSVDLTFIDKGACQDVKEFLDAVVELARTSAPERRKVRRRGR